jgi:hypothetical protein
MTILRRNKAQFLILVGSLLLASVAARGQTNPNAEAGAALAPQIQILYLARGGCQPAIIHRKATEFLLFVVNLSGKSDVQVALHAADGTAQISQQFSATQRNFVEDLNLKPGKYTLDGVNSSHHCQIVLE